MKVSLYTDGGARGNPGPAGIGVVAIDEQKSEVFTLSRYIGEATNNVAEYTALLEGLVEAKKRGVKEIAIFADSELMVRQIQGRYKVKNMGLKKIFDQVKELLGSFSYRIEHIPREENERADELANQAIDEGCA